MVEQYPGNSEEFEGSEKTPAKNTVQLNSSSAALFNGGSSRWADALLLLLLLLLLSRVASLRCAVCHIPPLAVGVGFQYPLGDIGLGSDRRRRRLEE